MKCPRCGNTICNCLLEDPGYLARAVGKELSRLSGCEADSPTTIKNGNPIGRDQGNNGTAILLPCQNERNGDGGSGSGNGGFGTKNNKTRATLIGTGASSDEFYTPDYAISPLLPYLPKEKVIWECAWGTGELGKHLRAAGYQVVGRAEMDFLKEQPEEPWNVIVTNPPYSFKNEFLARAYSFGKPFAFLLPIESLGGGRVRLYREHGIELLVPDKRINFHDPHGQPNKGTFATAWFCWKLLPKQLVFVKVDW